ncbi:hypothetical protein DICPUDRAFT_76000 [Dictyostelium purpureum]|uniref:Uncharacterized protein n=1 Tax=Dictyostelium purpureum TaxID=5786 RepID=F0ZCA3_DICPU|nr:uncharacterized protein DICPUDRAFT_76000 [Dictyostelium purpureum]EGC38385.1 hypothetical protein DICPUDRAFT_76000 [Dictyostelium purpureum]|eukprot:XP_003285046.1 hypothetical protein DICPUDRAFT_76000 [Dictyostelium purpureum]
MYFLKPSNVTHKRHRLKDSTIESCNLLKEWNRQIQDVVNSIDEINFLDDAGSSIYNVPSFDTSSRTSSSKKQKIQNGNSTPNNSLGVFNDENIIKIRTFFFTDLISIGEPLYLLKDNYLVLIFPVPVLKIVMGEYKIVKKKEDNPQLLKEGFYLMVSYHFQLPTRHDMKSDMRYSDIGTYELELDTWICPSERNLKTKKDYFFIDGPYDEIHFTSEKNIIKFALKRKAKISYSDDEE